MSDSFDADLHGSTAEGRQVVALHVYDHQHAAKEAIANLAKHLPGAEFTDVEAETGFFDAIVEAPDREEAIGRVWSALGAAGADDQIALAEHADIPQHWRTKER